MLTLGIESSCDETSASVVLDGKTVLSNIIASQHEIHTLYGGVVPELACRKHIENIGPVVSEALKEAGKEIETIDLISVTAGPGLVVALLVGLSYAKGLAYAMGKPLVGVNHLEGHMLSIFLENPNINFPFISLIVSGGHTDIYRVMDFGNYSLIGRTRDDAAGEALDKGAKLLGLGYPGGPEIERRANAVNPAKISFPRIFLEKGSLDFSFSGLKTALRNYLAKTYEDGIPEIDIPDIAASYQQAVIDTLTHKVITAATREEISTLVVAGGVAANKTLRNAIQSKADEEGMTAHFPSPVLCTDNAAMIACAGYHRYIANPEKFNNFLELDADSRMKV